MFACVCTCVYEYVILSVYPEQKMLCSFSRSRYLTPDKDLGRQTYKPTDIWRTLHVHIQTYINTHACILTNFCTICNGYTVCLRTISNSIVPKPRHFFVRGRRPRTKKCRGWGTILLDIVRKHTVYPIYIPFYPLSIWRMIVEMNTQFDNISNVWCWFRIDVCY